MSLSNQLLETALRLDELYSEGGQKTSLLFLVKYKKIHTLKYMPDFLQVKIISYCSLRKIKMLFNQFR